MPKRDAASGIGQATGIHFAKAGYAVFGGYMKLNGLAETATAVQKVGGTFVPAQVDV